MNKFQVILTLAVVGCSLVLAEPPVLSGGYGYRRPSTHSGLHTSVSHGFSSHGISGNDIGGAVHYSTTGSGGSYHTNNEGLYVDPDLLHKVKEILLQHENLEQQHRNQQHNAHHAHHSHHISDTYGPPSLQYGVPHYDERVVGIELGHIRPSIQVAHLHQAEHHHIPSISYGVPIHHSVPSGSYGVPSIPSGSYGVPSIPSGSYGVPSEQYIPPSIHAPSASYGAPSVQIQIPSGSYGVPEHHHHH